MRQNVRDYCLQATIRDTSENRLRASIPETFVLT